LFGTAGLYPARNANFHLTILLAFGFGLAQPDQRPDGHPDQSDTLADEVPLYSQRWL
jgi:hypothetical protein